METIVIPSEIIVLKNGKKVANFSSPHPFRFDDGSVLPAISNDESERLKVIFIEKIADNGDVLLDFELSDAVREQMLVWKELYDETKVDVVYCPLPMIQAIKKLYGGGIDFQIMMLRCTPFRAVRMEDRIKKLVSSTKQCL